MARYDNDTVEGRVQRLTRWIKNLIPEATVDGIAGIVGCAITESNCDPTNYEARFTGAGTLTDENTPPTAEDIFGSWDAFYALYNYQGLDVGFYNGNGAYDKHFIGTGLWQWTGSRVIALYEWCKSNGKKPFSWEAQLNYALSEPSYSDIFRNTATSTSSASDNASYFGANWEGNSGSIYKYVANAEEWYSTVEEELKNGDGKFSEPSSSSSGGNSSQKPGNSSNSAKKKSGTGFYYIQNDTLWLLNGNGSGNITRTNGTGTSSGSSDSSGSGSNSDTSTSSFTDPEDQKLWNETENENPSGGDSLTEHTRHVRAFIMKKFGLTEAHGWRQDDDGTGHGHNSGMAVDFMVGFDTNVNSELGQKIANYFQNNFDALGCYYLIWQQHFYMNVDNKYGSANTWNPMEDRGSPTQNHMDHVHVSFAR